MKKTSVNNLEYLDISQTVNRLNVPMTPFYSFLVGAGKVSPATSTEVKWRESDLNEDDSSAQLEGGEYPEAKSDRPWYSNYTEIFRKSTSVSGTMDAINVLGVGKELTTQTANRLIEMKSDLNKKLLVGVKADEVASVGRQMNGLVNMIHPDHVLDTKTAGKITRKDIDEMFQIIWDAGYGGDKIVIASPTMVNMITDAIETESNYSIKFGETNSYGLRLGNLISNYGQATVLMEPAAPTTSLIAFDSNYIELNPLRDWGARELPQTTDSKRIGLLGEFTTKYTASKSGAILNLNVDTED